MEKGRLNCPHCGNPVKLSKARLSDRIREAKLFRAASWAGQNAATLSRVPDEIPADVIRTPVRAPNPQADFETPVKQAVFTGVLSACGTCLVGSLVWSMTGWAKPVAWVSGLTVGAGWLVTTTTWLKSLAESKNLLYKIEEWLDVDLNRDQSVGRPDKTIKVELRDIGGFKYFDLPLDEDKMRAVAHAVLRIGESFSRPGLCDRQGILSQNEYHDLASTLENAGLLIKHANNTRELTAAGKKLLGELL